MEDYIRGILCGYLTVQHGVQDDAKKKRMFLVLTDSRMDYYVTDPRPEFEQKIADAYMFTPETRIHYYVELNARAPPYSFCLTTDKTTDVYIAESDQDAKMWYRHVHERLDALATVVRGTLLLRKEIAVSQQFKRMLLKTKYKWKHRYMELGRSSLRFCKESDKKTKMMKQFTLTARSFVSEEGVEFLRQHRILASYATAIQPDAKLLKRFKQQAREQQSRGPVNSTTARAASPRVSAAYPFVVATGQAHLFLAAPTESARADWVTAIRMRIIALKYRHNGDAKLNKKAPSGQSGEDEAYQLHGFMDVQLKPGDKWKTRYVEVDNDMVRIKLSERKVGSKFETRLIPTCQVAPTLLKANAFVLRNLGREISLAPSSIKEAERWMATLQRATKAVSVAKYQRIFEDDVRALLHHSVVYTLDVPADAQVGLVVERFKKRIVVLSHQPPSSDAAAMNKKMKKQSSKLGSPIIPQGSVLVSISQFDMAHESFENIWHKLRHKKGYQHPMTLTFRVPCTKQGVLGIKWRPRDAWVLRRCILQHGQLLVTSLDAANTQTEVIAELPLRYCQVELMSDDDCANGLKVTLTGSATSALATTLFMSVPLDSDAFLWFAFLHLESAVLQDDFRYPLSVAALANSKKPKRCHPLGVREDQRRCFQQCSVIGMQVDEIEKLVQATDPMLVLKPGNNDAAYAATAAPGVKPADIQIAMGSTTSTKPVRQLSESEMTAFFQCLDAIGCGKLSSAALVRTMEAITRHIDRQSDAHHHHQQLQNSSESTEEVSATKHHGVLAAFHAALDTLNIDKKEHFSLSMSEFRTVMQSITDAEVVDLVHKMTRHDIQCM